MRLQLLEQLPFAELVKEPAGILAGLPAGDHMEVGGRGRPQNAHRGRTFHQVGESGPDLKAEVAMNGRALEVALEQQCRPLGVGGDSSRDADGDGALAVTTNRAGDAEHTRSVLLLEVDA